MFAIVLALSWSELRHIHPRYVRLAVRHFDAPWLVAAAVITVANIAVMGVYDVIAFRRTRCRWQERWRHGAVAFAWSNFLTLGPLAGPAVRLWLYRSDVDDLSELHSGIAAIAIAFMSGLVGWTLASVAGGWLIGWSGAGTAAFLGLCAASFGLVLLSTSLARIVARRIRGAATEDVTFPGRPGARRRRVGRLAACRGGVHRLLSCGRGGRGPLAQLHGFFIGQALGVASLVPGGVGSSDAYLDCPPADARKRNDGGSPRVSNDLLRRAVGDCIAPAACPRDALRAAPPRSGAPDGRRSCRRGRRSRSS